MMEVSYKSIDLQMSIPRTPEASGIHGQQLHKPLADQNQLAHAASEQTVELRHRNTGLTETTGQTIRDKRKRSDGQSPKRGKSSVDTKQEDAHSAELGAAHPFKGKHIDVSL
jgi:hypothetical protein